MTEVGPFLVKCDTALAEADRLLAFCALWSDLSEIELAATRARIAALRHEVERLSGMTPIPPRRKIHPEWIDLAGGESPWSARDKEWNGDNGVGAV